MNTMKTFMLMATLTALFMVGGQAMGGQQGMTIALVLALGLNFFAYWNSDKLALAMNRAREVSVAEAPDLHALVASLAGRAGIPKPKVYVVDDPTPNAFATGRNPEHAAVAVTTGILQTLDRYELEGVIAHELAHIKNRDILIGSIAAVMAGAISYLATMAQWSMLFGGGRSDDEGGSNPLVMIVTMLVAPLAASLIQMAISRGREYMADATGAEICGHPKSLASALNKLANSNAQRPMNINPASAQMYIVNPLSGGSIANLFSTHPPMEERIRRLLSM
ncbi:zinc metalloprotease HtpX [uncultured Desulfobulbus sp.]|uniref:zinc metalloprotease HtpX n=1 Tax=uncultured Desulfobulbus sp. TaxID=239745 RepID=UPI0029C7D21F|nr:zinc metalloprotease HtpX [uncultured Desulfobulbus sp.]